MSNGNESAYPQQLVEDRHGDYVPVGNSGLTKRELIAAKVLAGFAANPAVFAESTQFGWGLVNCDKAGIAAYSAELADALLAALQGDGQ